MSSWKDELFKKCKLCTSIGLALGLLFGLFPDSKTASIYGPEYMFFKVIEGLVFGAVLGILFGTLNIVYRNCTWQKPFVGTFVCFLLGFLLAGFWGYMKEGDKAWELRTATRTPEVIHFQLAMRDGLLGGLVGTGLGAIAGSIHHFRLRNRARQID
jgi:hypothetical protein